MHFATCHSHLHARNSLYFPSIHSIHSNSINSQQFQQLSDTLPNVVFLKVDVDEDPETAAKYNVSAMPTFVFVKDGAVLDRLMGASPDRLQELLHEYAG